MPIRLIPFAAMIALAACTPQVSQTASYAYLNYWGTAPSLAVSPEKASSATSLPSTKVSDSSTALFGTHTAASPGVWLYPPDPYQ